MFGGALIAYYDETMSLDLQKELVAGKMEFPDIDDLIKILLFHNVKFELGHYKTYLFASLPAKDEDVVCLSRHDSRAKAFGFDGLEENIYAIERNGVLVSACVSTRENDRCGEAWVYTNPEYRYQGLARKVVNAWARDLKNTGKVPFYSHNIENEASASLAKRLGLRPVFEEITITQVP